MIESKSKVELKNGSGVDMGGDLRDIEAVEKRLQMRRN
jgi:hypothetical protein